MNFMKLNWSIFLFFSFFFWGIINVLKLVNLPKEVSSPIILQVYRKKGKKIKD